MLLSTATGLIAALALVVAVSLAPDAPDSKSSAQVYWDAAPSTVAILVPGPGDTTGSSGTGFYVTPHLLLTCAHVTDSARTCRVLRSFSDSNDVIVGRVLFADTLTDVAIVHTDTASQAPPLEFGETEVGAPVFAIGNPHGYLASFSSGVVSQLRRDADRERGLVQCTSAIGPGSSGGPILNAKGEVVGMASFVDGDADYVYAFGVDAKTLRRTMWWFEYLHEKSRKPGWSHSWADTSGWAEVTLVGSDLDDPMVWPDPKPWEYLLDEIGLTLLSTGPIALCLLGLGAVLLRRTRRLRRQSRQGAIRQELERLKQHAFLPDSVIEAECLRA